MRQQDGLSGLQVRLAGHDGVRVCTRLSGQRLDDVEHTRCDRAHRSTQPHAEQGGDLVVSRPASAQPATEFGSDAFDQPTLECAVYVLVGLCRLEGSVSDITRKLAEAGKHGSQIVVGEQTGTVQYTRMGLRRLDVERCEHPVELRRLAQRRHRLGRTRREAATPERSLVGGSGSAAALITH